MSSTDTGDRRSKFGKFRPKKLTRPEFPLDYKNVDYLMTLVGPTGKLMSRRRTGFSGQDQRKLATQGESYRAWVAATPFLPFSRLGSLRGLVELPLPIAAGVGVALAWALRRYAHGWLAG